MLKIKLEITHINEELFEQKRRYEKGEISLSTYQKKVRKHRTERGRLIKQMKAIKKLDRVVQMHNENYTVIGQMFKGWC